MKYKFNGVILSGTEVFLIIFKKGVLLSLEFYCRIQRNLKNYSKYYWGSVLLSVLLSFLWSFTVSNPQYQKPRHLLGENSNYPGDRLFTFNKYICQCRSFLYSYKVSNIDFVINYFICA
jgi:hypothetical protein